MRRILIYGDSEIKKSIEIKNYLIEDAEVVKIDNSVQDAVEILKHNLFSNSLFGGKKVLIINNIDKFKKKEFTEITKLLSQVSSESIENIIITASSKVKVEVEEKKECNLPKPWEEDKWIEFIKELAEDLKCKFENDETIKYILDIYGYTDTILYEEMKKISIYSEGIITKEAINEIGFAAVNVNFEEFAYMLSTKRCDEVINMAKNFSQMHDFNIVSFISYIFRYFFDLYRVIINIEPKKRFSWPEVQKISQISGVNKMRVKKFLGVKFKNETQFYANHSVLYSKKDIMDIIIKLEEMDRKAKLGEKQEILIFDLISYICG
ncbi:hypothetical protein XO10_09900 [Marinitoga sp. 1135]|uniref:DNA polymerase III subunit delta n=1 Tax=Marinitoga sp. 1135 TaxID=1643333 RepID=UPI001585EAEA|nr:hypothetical protein [Marinitoga sp. 1135]NUU96546.1 hypothetical protein [Marinitoga sp. 1135]